MSPLIVFAEDEPDLREVVAEYLRAAEFRVIEAGSGAELRQAVTGQRVDLALLDIMMPGEDGLSLARWFKGQGPVGVILATTLGRPGDLNLGLDHGADDYVVKPYVLRELVARVRGVLRRWSWTEISAPRIDRNDPGRAALSLDSERRAAVGREGLTAALSAAEYELLAYFADRRGRIVLREDPGLAIGMTGDPRGVDVRVARVRKKLCSLPGAAESLSTIRGEGYCLDGT